MNEFDRSSNNSVEQQQQANRNKQAAKSRATGDKKLNGPNRPSV